MSALAIALSFIALLVALPLVASIRALRVRRELDEVRDRLAAVEARLRDLSTPVNAAEAVPAAPPRPVEAGPPPAPPPILVIKPEPSPRDEEPAAQAPFSPVLAATAAETENEPLDLEGRIGGRWLLYTGVLVLLFGVSFFLKYAFENRWINETGRVVLGALAGMGLVAGGWRLASRELRAFGQALIGTGLAILYLSVYAALTYYGLINRITAFGLMLIVTVAAAWLADRQRSQALAFIAVGGGFLTPFLVGGSEDAQLTLFTYDALLIAGTLVLALRHEWHWLNALSYALTVMTILAWAFAHYSDRVWLRTFLFLTLYCAMFVQILRVTRASRPRPARMLTMVLLATAPVLYHITAVILTSAHPPAIHIYIIAFTAIGLWLTAEPHRPGWRLLVLAGGFIPLFGSVTLPAGISWSTANTVTIVGVAALHLLAILDRVFRQDHRLTTSELLAFHLAMLGVFGLLYQTLGATYPELRGAIAALLAMIAGVLWQLLLPRDEIASLNACAIAFTLTALAIAVQFDGPAVIIGWAAEGAAATWVGLRAASLAFQGGGLMLWGLAIARLLDGYFVTPAGFTAIFNERSLTTAFLIVLGYVLAAMFKRHRDTIADAGRTRAVLHVAASILTVLWITAEVNSYWDIRYETPQAYLYEQLIRSLAWGIYGALLIVAGMWRGYAPDRYIGITVLAITALKVFFYDLWELGGIYRVIGFIAFGVLLVAISYLYQQRRRVNQQDVVA